MLRDDLAYPFQMLVPMPNGRCPRRVGSYKTQEELFQAAKNAGKIALLYSNTAFIGNYDPAKGIRYSTDIMWIPSNNPANPFVKPGYGWHPMA